MNHEEARDKEVNIFMEKEENEPLYIRGKLVSPMVVIGNHSIIFNDVDLTPKYIYNQEQAILHFEDTFWLLGIEIMLEEMACLTP